LKDTAIVIPVTDIRGDKNKDQLTRLLDSIREIPNVEYILVCFDSCDSEFVKHFITKYKEILPITNDKNRLQFARNANKGMRYAHKILDRSVLLVNQDCILPKFLGNWNSQEGVTCGTVYNADSCELLNKMNEEESRGSLLTEINSKFAFNCVYIDKTVMDKVGYLDGSFICTFEDDDYITRTRLAGFRTYQSDVKFYHEGDFIDSAVENWESASGSYTQYTLNVNLMKYGTKYQIPREIEHKDMLQWVLEHHTWTDERRVP
jgi:GT2 family glycosyltransferase